MHVAGRAGAGAFYVLQRTLSVLPVLELLGLAALLFLIGR